MGQNPPVSIPQAFIQEVLSRTDVVEVVGRYVQLKKGGANFMGLCPFHGEKSPSFSVSPSKQFYHCFGCGANGNAISFLMEHGGMSFVEAVKDLAQQCGLAVPADDADPADRARAQQLRQQQQSLTGLLAQVAAAYQKQLKQNPRAIGYLKGRGLSGEVARQFGLGYAPEGWRSLAGLVPDYNDPRLVESGLVIASESSDAAAEGDGVPAPRAEKRYDRFRDRIMFPIRNVKGETIGFGGRVLDRGEPKYLNSPETPVFSKGRELYGLFEARTAIRQAGYALVTEGYMDVVALAQLGFAQAVATLGTACTAEHVQKLFRFTDAVVFAFDGDAAGRRAAVKAMHAALPFALDTRSLRFLFLPPEHDPDSYIRTHGAEAFARAVTEAMPLSRFLRETAASGCTLSEPEGRARMLSQAQPLWQALPDGVLKRQMLAELAQAAALPTAELTSLWAQPPARGQGGSSPPPAFATGTTATRPQWPDTQDWGEHPKRSNGWPPPQRREWSGTRPPWRGGNRPAPSQGPAVLLGRTERIARILLTQPDAWTWLSTDDLQLLAQQQPPAGALLVWLERHWHEHGALGWDALAPALAGEPFAPLAHRLVQQRDRLGPTEDGQDPPTDSPQDARRELTELLTRLRIDDLKAQETEALAQAGTDPQALQRYRTVHDQRLALQQQLQQQLQPPAV